MRIAFVLLFVACGGSTTTEQVPAPKPDVPCERFESIDDECGSPGYLCRKGIGPEGCELYTGPGGSPVYTALVCCDH